jgi:protein AroM
MKIGAVTIGQSPRVDIVPEILEVLGPGVEILERGALDGLSLKEVNDFRPGRRGSILITRMKDGTEVKVTRQYVMQRLTNCISELEGKGAELSILLCTEDFPEIESKKLLLRPNRILQNMAEALSQKWKLGVIIPSPDQIQTTKKKWGSRDSSVVGGVISPYTGAKKQIFEMANKFKDLRVDLTILDCMGFNRMTKAVFRHVTKSQCFYQGQYWEELQGKSLRSNN